MVRHVGLLAVVTDSMMPEGVEHLMLADRGYPVTSDRFHDAGRR